MSAIVQNIYRYPVKGLSPEILQSVSLSKGEGIPGDRQFAFARSSGLFNSSTPTYLPKTNFLMLQKHERLAQLKTTYLPTTTTLIIQHSGNVFEADLSDNDGRFSLERFMADFMGSVLTEHPKLEMADGHVFADFPAKVLSIINLNSVRDLSLKLKRVIDPLRFRANIYIDGIEPWQEFTWLGRTIKLGSTELLVIKRIQRCAATNVDPVTAKRNLNIPRILEKEYGHLDMGIYTSVTSGGHILTGDNCETSS